MLVIPTLNVTIGLVAGIGKVVKCYTFAMNHVLYMTVTCSDRG